jgi:CHAT domain-containing protein/Tfp pilus assembly protein PilF
VPPRAWVRILTAAALLSFCSPAASQEEDPFAPFLPHDPQLNALRDLLDEGKYAEAEAGAREEMSRLESEASPDSTDLAYALECLVESQWRAGKTRGEEIETLALRSLHIREMIHGPESFHVQNSVLNLGVLYWRRGDLGKARSYFERNVSLLESALGPDAVGVGAARNNLGLLEWQLGDLDRAREDLERSATTFEEQLGAEHPFVAQNLGNLGMLLVEAGDYAKADALLERAVALGRNSLGPTHPEFARTLAARALLLWVLGDYSVGIRCAEESLRLREEVLGPEHMDVAESLIGLANLLRETGDFERAEHLYERGVRVREAALGASHPEVADDLLQWAQLLRRKGASAEVIPLYERALAIYESAGIRGPSVARTLASLALAQDAAGHTKQARVSLQRALAIWAEEGGHPEEATCLEHRGSLDLRDGRLDDAERELERARRLIVDSLGPQHPRVASVVRGLSEVTLERGDPRRALDLALAAEKVSREHLRSVAVQLEERQAMRYAGTRFTSLDLALSLVSENRDLPGTDRVFDAVVRSRAMVLDEMANRCRAFRESGDPAIRAQWEELAEARTRLANLLVRGPGDDLDRYRQALSLAQNAKVAAERALADMSEAFRAAESRSEVGIAEVSAHLGPGEGLVSYVRYTRAGSAEPRYLAFVLRGETSAPALVDLGAAAAIEDRVRDWREEAAWGEYDLTRSTRRSERAYREAGGRLREKIWDPLEHHLEKLDRVYVVFAGALHLVSLETLPVEQDEYLIERLPRIHVLSTERDLARVDAAIENGAGLLAMGGVSYDRNPRSAADTFRGIPSKCPQFRDLRFQPLPESEAEVNDIASLWRGQGQADVVTLTADRASEAAFKSRAPGTSVVHLATHGFFLGRNCGQRAEAPSPGSAQDAGDASPGARHFLDENPLLLSGLALAGANQRETDSPGAEDGILTAEEIAALDLRGLDWAVLSGCDTGLGKIDEGEGVLGLRRAFLLAGARSVVMSLWAVEDETARLWMTALYQARHRQHLDAIDASRAASLALLRDRRSRGESTHPFHWGAFVAVGGRPGRFAAE